LNQAFTCKIVADSRADVEQRDREALLLSKRAALKELTPIAPDDFA